MSIDHCQVSAATFDRAADRYQAKYMELSLYDAGYAAFCDLLPSGPASVLDVACGPGNAARFLAQRRPELILVGIDLAPRMVELARANVPQAQFAVHDCRDLVGLKRRFDGIICAFGLPYLTRAEAVALIAQASRLLNDRGVLYLSAMEGAEADSGFEVGSNGDGAYIHYHDADELIQALDAHGFGVVDLQRMASPSAASKRSSDLVVIALKR